jgi:hypothetical protein
MAMRDNVRDNGDERDGAVLDQGPGADIETQIARQTGASEPEDQERPGAALPGELSPVVHAEVTPGMAVFGAEGDSLGVVGEVAPGWFRIDTNVGVGSVMYLPFRYVEDVVRERVILNAPSGLLYDMRLTEPPERPDAVQGREAA